MTTVSGRSAANAASGHSRAEPKEVSALRASVPNAAIAIASKPFTVFGARVTGRQIADAIDLLANLPHEFLACDLVGAVLPGASYIDKQEALNRLFQRWRRLGFARFNRGKWSLAAGAWSSLQASAIEARRAATVEQGAVHESAGPQDDAHD